MDIQRYPENPLITPAQVKPSRPDFEVIGAFNAGVAEYQGEVLLLMRVAERPIWADPQVVRAPVLRCQEGGRAEIEILEFRRDDPAVDLHDPRIIGTPKGPVLTSISHLRLARSRDGRRFVVEEQPALFPDRPSEAFGIEDPRITELEGTYYIAYKSVAPNAITQTLASTTDFRTFTKHGLIFCPENMDVAILPERVGGRYVALHRPVPRYFGGPNMWLAYSPDLHHWGDHHLLIETRPGQWDNGRVGAGAVPIKTALGWLEIYHGATPQDHYCLGALLLDLEEPHRVLARSPEPIMSPEASYETAGFVPNVVFTCGAIVRGDRVSVYYGAADMVIAGAEVSLAGILATV